MTATIGKDFTKEALRRELKFYSETTSHFVYFHTAGVLDKSDKELKELTDELEKIAEENNLIVVKDIFVFLRGCRSKKALKEAYEKKHFLPIAFFEQYAPGESSPTPPKLKFSTIGEIWIERRYVESRNDTPKEAS